jgi:hypothetical protein
MTVTIDLPAAAMNAGASPAELAIMRQAAARLSGIPAGTGNAHAPDPFGALAAPFRSAPPDSRRWWAQHDGGPQRWWCT